MKILRLKLISGISIWLVITGLMCINASIGKLSQLYPNANVNSFLVEEINKDLEDTSSESGSNMDGDTGFLDEFDWHLSFLLHLNNLTDLSSEKLHQAICLDFGNVHLDRFSPPPEPYRLAA
jgi:hypothetical protein